MLAFVSHGLLSRVPHHSGQCCLLHFPVVVAAFSHCFCNEFPIVAWLFCFCFCFPMLVTTVVSIVSLSNFPIVVTMISLLWLPLWWFLLPHQCHLQFPFVISVTFLVYCSVWLLSSLSSLHLSWPSISYCCLPVSHHVCNNFNLPLLWLLLSSSLCHHCCHVSQ